MKIPAGQEARQASYEGVADEFESDGLRLANFFDNRSYFRKDASGRPVPLAGSHPTLIHWPLSQYQGSAELLAALGRETERIEDLAGPGKIVWVDPRYWHSTVFSPVHSSDPDVIGQVNTDMSALVRQELQKTRPYTLSLTRILFTRKAGIKAVGYAGNDELDRLRSRLKRGWPKGDAPDWVHISLGNFVELPAPQALESFQEMSRRFRGDRVLLGQLAIDALTYAHYRAPFLTMTVEEISRQPLGQPVGS